MSGIAGFVGLKFDNSIVDKMLNSMQNRGPDGSGLYQYDDCCLLQCSLKISEVKSNTKPVIFHSKNETYVIVFDGELYNTEELKGILGKCGKYTMGSDAETVLHAYLNWGEKCVERLNGNFAFAIWEEKNKRLFLARDRMGVKPLFYKLHEQGIIFASEIKTLFRYPTVKAELDAEGAAQILLLGPGRIPGSGVYRGIMELEPGCYGYYHLGRWNRARYWKLLDRVHTESFEETVECVQWLITDAIHRQIYADTPVGAFLSGGLDSGIVSSLCNQELLSRGETLRTFSVDYKDNDVNFIPGKFQPDSDPEYIQIMQEFLQSDQHWTILQPEQLTECLADSVIARDLPGMADIDASLLLFAREVRNHVKVVFSGECADEIFGGYPWYRDPEIRAREGFPWAQNTSERAGILNSALSDKIDPIAYVNDQYQLTLSQCDILPDCPEDEKRIKELVNLNQRWFMQTLSERNDRMCMQCGLEVRVPFCDYRIAEYMYGVPWAFKDYKGREKGLLRHAMAGILPDRILKRKKSPYPKTHDPAYTNAVSKQMQELLSQKDEPIFQLVDRMALEQLLVREFSTPWYGQLMRRPQTMAYMLQINFWLKHYKVDILL